MSLLMDALRRAEEAKRKAGNSTRPTAAAPGELRLDPLETTTVADDGIRPSLADDMGIAAAVPGEQATTRSPARRAAASAETAPEEVDSRQYAERMAARNLFAVKQAPRSRAALWLFLGLGSLAMIAIAGYFWWQLQSFAGGTLSAPASAVRPQPTPAASTPAAPTLAERPALPAIDAPAETSPAADLRRSAPTDGAASAGGMADPPRPAKPAARSPAGAPAAAAPRVFQRGSSQPQPAKALASAYEAWLDDRLDDSRRAYEQVLRSDPRNADALLGLAAIAARHGQLERAQALYLQVLEADPGNVTAQAALINLRGQSGADQSESRLKTLIGRQPDSAALYFALGNLFAGQERWSEAQQAYFQAYALDPANADHLFNVAVSLDHLRQKKLAAQYYEMALSAAQSSPSAFDRRAAMQRLRELQQ